MDLADRSDLIYLYDVDPNKRALYLGPTSAQDDEHEAEIEHRAALRFIKGLHLLESAGAREIVLHLVTCGGEFSYGMAIYDAIAASPCHITSISYAWARSMSSIIPQACDRRIIMPNCRFMVHLGDDSFDGAAVGVEAFAREHQHSVECMLNAYVERCADGRLFQGYELDEIKQFILRKMQEHGDWWLSPAEAVCYGFMDAVWTDGIEI